MSGDLLPSKLPSGVKITETGMVLAPGMDYAVWAELGKAIGRSSRVMVWALGDWLVYGEHAYGEKYVQAAEGTGYDSGTLMNLNSLCSRVPREVRREGLAPGH